MIWWINFSEVFFFDKQGLFPQRVSTGTGLDPTQRRLAAVSEIMGKIEGGGVLPRNR